MNRASTRCGVVLLVVVATALAALAGVGGAGAAGAADAGANTSAPGAAVGAAIGAQGASLNATMAAATLSERLAAAETPAARARVAATALDGTATRLDRLEARLAALRAARANGSLDDDAYAVRVAPVGSRARTAAAVLARVRSGTADLDPELRREANVTRERVAALQSRADSLVAATDAAAGAGLGPGFYRRLATVVGTYNERAPATDLGVVGAHVNGQRVDLRIERAGGDVAVVSFRTTESGRVRDLRAGSHPEASVRMTVSESTAEDVLRADDPGAATRRAFARGDIRVAGVGPLNALRWTVLNVVLDGVRLLVDLLGVGSS